MIKESTNKSLEQDILEGVVLIDFWAPWCTNCRMMMPFMERLENEIPNIKICKVNVQEEDELAKKYSVMTLPTFVVVKNGEEVNRIVGVRPFAKLANELKSYFD